MFSLVNRFHSHLLRLSFTTTSIRNCSNISPSFSSPLLDSNRVYTNLYGEYPVDLYSSESRGDWYRTNDILLKGRDWIINELKVSGLRGRGGAGFPTGLKYAFMPKSSESDHYLIVNADEGEVGTSKDRQILRNEPHKVIEGAVIAARAAGAQHVFVYIRGEFVNERKVLQKAINEAIEKGLILPSEYKSVLGESLVDKSDSAWPVSIVIHHGAGAYVCGEETALLESLEGRMGKPRIKPPFPAQKGLYSCPTIISNVETVSSMPTIMRRGSKWYRSLGREGNHGTKLFSISGSVNSATTVEEEMGVSLKMLIEKHGGGVEGGWENLMAVIPGGASTPMLSRKVSEYARMDYDGMREVGSGLGTGAVIVMNHQVDLIEAIARLEYFYRHESCGQCTPCREGTGILFEILEKVQSGSGKEEDLTALESTAKSMIGRTICAMGEASALPVLGLLRNFRPLLESKLK